MLFNNASLIKIAEIAVDEGKIVVPPTEVRTCRFIRDCSNRFDVGCELSRLGIRFESGSDHLGEARLIALIENAFENEKESLKWKLRTTTGADECEKLRRHIHDASQPDRVLREFIFSDEKRLRKGFEFLNIRIEAFPQTAEAEERLLHQMIWKLGFETPFFPEYINTFLARHSTFSKAYRSSSPYSETQKEEIRSAAVNFFVSLEDILDRTLSFSAWLLLKDHFAETNYRFEINSARKFMAESLDGRSVGTQEPVRFETERQNTLYPMIKGFELLADLCEEYLSNPGEFKRDEEDFPSYDGESRLFRFPFRHTTLILDLKNEKRIEVLEVLRKIAKDLETANVCDIRNRIEHKRDEFPLLEEIEKATSAIEAVLELTRKIGLTPNLYRKIASNRDENGRGTITMLDSEGREFNLPTPSNCHGLRLPSLSGGVLLVPIVLIGDTIEPIRFRLEVESEYSNMWKNYPRRTTTVETKDGDQEGSNVAENGPVEQKPEAVRMTVT